ncbi:response regulator transcription factor [Desulfogranum mediterraneum]|uniref:response regulator transcription factor n=1 Tax=Desulfogranum mediterraneum TaxID=160661 RepID=UPI0004044A26|nr:response regulator transcription factor [Desulfogranum mediterraneum]
MKTLLVYKEQSNFQVFKEVLAQHPNISLEETDDPAAALQRGQEGQAEVIVVDEALSNGSGIQFIEQLVKLNPMVNTALVSGLGPGKFHEATEGLGILVQLSPVPGQKDAEYFMEKLAKVALLLEPLGADPS